MVIQSHITIDGFHLQNNEGERENRESDGDRRKKSWETGLTHTDRQAGAVSTSGARILFTVLLMMGERASA